MPCPTPPQGNGPGAPLYCFLSAWRLQPCPEECRRDVLILAPRTCLCCCCLSPAGIENHLLSMLGNRTAVSSLAARDPYHPPCKVRGEGGAGEGGRQVFPQKFSSRPQNAKAVSKLALSSFLGGGSEPDQQPTDMQFLRDPAPGCRPACITTAVSTAVTYCCWGTRETCLGQHF